MIKSVLTHTHLNSNTEHKVTESCQISLMAVISLMCILAELRLSA